MDVKIRQMKLSDWKKVLNIFEQGIKNSFQSALPSYEKWHSSHTKNCRLVAIVNEEVVGWTALAPMSSAPALSGAVEVSIYVDENFRGNNIGYLLLKNQIEESEKNGYWSLQANIREDNIKSLNLHKKCGFRTIGYRQRIGKDRQGIWRNIVLMERRSEII